MKLKQILEAKYASDNVVDLYIQADTSIQGIFRDDIEISPGIQFQDYEVRADDSGTPTVVYGQLSFHVTNAAMRDKVSMLIPCPKCKAKTNQPCRTYGGRKDSNRATRSHESRAGQLPDDAKVTQILKGFVKHWAKKNNVPYTKLKVVQVYPSAIRVRIYHDKAYVKTYHDFTNRAFPEL